MSTSAYIYIFLLFFIICPLPDPPKIIASPKWDTIVAAGKRLQLNCTASGFPVPIVVLTRENTTLAIAHGLASWTAYSVSTAEGGLYKCWAWNHEKTKADERIFKVHVKGAQSITGS